MLSSVAGSIYAECQRLAESGRSVCSLRRSEDSATQRSALSLHRYRRVEEGERISVGFGRHALRVARVVDVRRRAAGEPD